MTDPSKRLVPHTFYASSDDPMNVYLVRWNALTPEEQETVKATVLLHWGDILMQSTMELVPYLWLAWRDAIADPSALNLWNGGR